MRSDSQSCTDRNVAAVTVPPQAPEHDPAALRADLMREYDAIVTVVSAFDQRSMTIKGWSVTLSLASLGLGFQQGHYGLFGLGAMTALAFWGMDILTKRHQVSYYSRMRDIEVAMYHLNRVSLPELDEVSAPRIDMSWSFGSGRRASRDWRTDAPKRRSQEEVRALKAFRVWFMPHVFLPHALAVVLGVALFIAAAADVRQLADLVP